LLGAIDMNMLVKNINKCFIDIKSIKEINNLKKKVKITFNLERESDLQIRI